MELKLIERQTSNREISSINRTFMELKPVWSLWLAGVILGINRTFMELKQVDVKL